MSRNANLGCYTTAGVCARRPPGSLSASPPPSPPQPFRGFRARRRRLPAPPRVSGNPVSRPPGPTRLSASGPRRLAARRARRARRVSRFGRYEWGSSPQRFPGTVSRPRPSQDPCPGPAVLTGPSPRAGAARRTRSARQAPGGAANLRVGGWVLPWEAVRGPRSARGTGWARPLAARSHPPPGGFACLLFHLPSFFSPQIEADFRLNGECAPHPTQSLRPRLPPPRPAGAGQRTDMASQRLSPVSSLTGPIVPIGPPLDPLSGGPSSPRSRPAQEGATETPRGPPSGLGWPSRAGIPPGKVALSTVGT